MKTIRRASALVLFGVIASALGGCAATQQARTMDVKEGVLLDDYSMLREGKEGEVLRVYRNEQANWAGYSKVLIEPVLFPKPQKASDEELADQQKLANNLHANLVAQLGADYEVVTAPGPNTLRVEMAFFDVQKKETTGTFLSSVVPVGAAVSAAKEFATGKPLAVGEISGEAKITDAQSGALLGAALDRRVGQMYGEGMWDSWAEANAAVEYWAKRMRFAVCRLRGGANCVAP